MNKLFNTPLALAISAAFIIPVSLTSCSATPAQEKAAAQKDISPEDAARIADEKKKAAEKRQQRERQNQVRASGSCSQ